MEAALNSYGQLSYHLIFVTKYRRQILKAYRDELKLIFNEIAIEHQMKIYSIEVLDEHVHMFVSIKQTMSLSQAIQLLKGKSSYLLYKSHPEIRRFLKKHLWSRGKFVRSIGSVTTESVKHYIEESQSKHRTL